MNSPKTEEVNFDTLVGPTHNFSGLSYGNKASMTHAGESSSPRKAALQGLDKMRKLMQLGIKQGIFPPHERPFFPMFRMLGYHEAEVHLLQRILQENPLLLKQSASSSFMWTANCATISPSVDTVNQKVHLTPANLLSQFHRSFELPMTSHIIARNFDNPNFFNVHYALPPHMNYSDEGAANHSRFCRSHGEKGVHLFVYGKSIYDSTASSPTSFPARQSDEASKGVARLHQLDPASVLFAQQNPIAIDAGVFHNDVISFGNENVFIYHELAFVNTEKVVADLQAKVKQTCQTDLELFKISEQQLSLKDSVNSYFFNSQLVTKPDNTMTLIAAEECRHSEPAQKIIQEIISKSHRIKEVIYQDLSESMQNGGGPACLRIRAVLTPKELESMNPNIFLTETLYQTLVDWVNQYYRDRFDFSDLLDPGFLMQCKKALDELTWILQLGPVYNFQRQSQPQRR